MYICEIEKIGPKVILIDKKDLLVTEMKEIMPKSYHIICNLQINRNLLDKVIKYFFTKKQVKS